MGLIPRPYYPSKHLAIIYPNRRLLYPLEGLSY